MLIRGDGGIQFRILPPDPTTWGRAEASAACPLWGLEAHKDGNCRPLRENELRLSPLFPHKSYTGPANSCPLLWGPSSGWGWGGKWKATWQWQGLGEPSALCRAKLQSQGVSQLPDILETPSFWASSRQDFWTKQEHDKDAEHPSVSGCFWPKHPERQWVQWHSSLVTFSHQQVSSTMGWALGPWTEVSPRVPPQHSTPRPAWSPPWLTKPLCFATLALSKAPKPAGEAGQSPPRVGPLGNLASRISHIDSEQVKCSKLIFATASSRLLSFLPFTRKQCIWSFTYFIL